VELRTQLAVARQRSADYSGAYETARAEIERLTAEPDAITVTAAGGVFESNKAAAEVERLRTELAQAKLTAEDEQDMAEAAQVKSGRVPGELALARAELAEKDDHIERLRPRVGEFEAELANAQAWHEECLKSDDDKYWAEARLAEVIRLCDVAQVPDDTLRDIIRAAATRQDAPDPEDRAG
jgi:DNA repair exonuclease SbcCD ATPase subunit